MAEDSYQRRDMSLPQLMVDPALKSLAEELGMVELPRQNEALDLLVAKRGDRSDTGRPACREVARQHRGSTIRIVGGGRRCQTVVFAKGYPSVALFYNGGRKTFL